MLSIRHREPVLVAGTALTLHASEALSAGNARRYESRSPKTGDGVIVALGGVRDLLWLYSAADATDAGVFGLSREASGSEST